MFVALLVLGCGIVCALLVLIFVDLVGFDGCWFDSLRLLVFEFVVVIPAGWYLLGWRLFSYAAFCLMT